MKKIGLMCAVILAGLSLGGCGHGHNYNLKKLRAEHARLLRQSKKHTEKKHSKKKATKSSNKKTNKNSAAKSSSNNSDTKQNASSSKRANGNNLQARSNDQGGVGADVQANWNKGLNGNGTRRRDSFNSDADYQRYVAWYQGYNYDPSTNTYSQMNQQQLDDMRRQMNANAGQNFK